MPDLTIELRNETLNLIDDFILDHIDDFTNEELYWIINEFIHLQFVVILLFFYKIYLKLMLNRTSPCLFRHQ